MPSDGKKLRRKLAREQRQLVQAASEIVDRARGELTLDQEAEVDIALARAEQLDRRRRLVPKIERVREPDVYERGAPHSFVADLVASVAPFPVAGTDPFGARQRLEAHARQMEFAGEVSGELARRRAARVGVVPGQQGRALSTTAGSGGEFSPPRWEVEHYATVARAADPLRRLATRLPLPPNCQELVIPLIEVASGVVPTSVENVNPSQAIGDQTGSLTATVETFAGQVIVSEQLAQRSNFADIAAADLFASYRADVEFQLVNGSGAGGELLGVHNVPGALVQTWTQATPTAAGFVGQVAETAALVADTRDLPPQIILMRPSRYLWLAAAADSAGSPMQRIGVGSAADVAPDDGPFGPLAGLPVHLDGTIPSDLGAGADQDLVVCCRPSDLLVFEDPTPKFSAVVDTAAGASQLAVVLQFHTYVAAFTSRYPSGIGVLTGSGLTPPTFAS